MSEEGKPHPSSQQSSHATQPSPGEASHILKQEESSMQHRHTAYTKSSALGDNSSAGGDNPVLPFALQQERSKRFHSSQIVFLRTSQIQLKHEVKTSCDGVRREVQRPGTQATAGNPLGQGSSTPSPAHGSLTDPSHWHLLLFSDLVEEFHVLYHGICWPIDRIVSVPKYCGRPWCMAT